MVDDESPPSLEELAEAEALRQALEGGSRASEDAQAAALVAAASGRLGDVAARRIVRAAVAAARKRPSQLAQLRRSAGVALGAAAAAVVLFVVALPDTPRTWMSRPAGSVVPGPFSSQQTAAQRLDLIAANRLEAFRESRRYR
jgi:hypothetical protein